MSDLERDFAKQVIELMHLYGWLVGCHDKSARKLHGRWITNILGDRGEPDIRAVRPPRFLLVELKSGVAQGAGRKEGGAKVYGLTEEQARWRDVIAQVPAIEYHVWEPKDLASGAIARILIR